MVKVGVPWEGGTLSPTLSLPAELLPSVVALCSPAKGLCHLPSPRDGLCTVGINLGPWGDLVIYAIFLVGGSAGPGEESVYRVSLSGL